MPEDFEDRDDSARCELCHLLQLGSMKHDIPYFEHPHKESPFRLVSLSQIMTDVKNSYNDIPSVFQGHEECLKAAAAYAYISKHLDDIKRLEFDQSWNWHRIASPTLTLQD